MASAITTAATTLEGQLLEIAETAATYQANPTNNPNGTTVISGYNRNMLTQTVSFSVTMSTADTMSGGAISVSAEEVFVDA